MSLHDSQRARGVLVSDHPVFVAKAVNYVRDSDILLMAGFPRWLTFHSRSIHVNHRTTTPSLSRLMSEGELAGKQKRISVNLG